MAGEHVIVLCDAFGPTRVITGFCSWAHAETYLRDRAYTQEDERPSKWWSPGCVWTAHIVEAEVEDSMLGYLERTA